MMQPSSPNVTTTNIIFGKFISMETSALVTDGAPVHDCKKNNIKLLNYELHQDCKFKIRKCSSPDKHMTISVADLFYNLIMDIPMLKYKSNNFLPGLSVLYYKCICCYVNNQSSRDKPKMIEYLTKQVKY